MKKKSKLFEILKNITETKEDRWYEFQNGYSAFIINRYLSMHKDTLPFAYEMNKGDFTDKEQYYFYLYGIPNKKRWLGYINASKIAKLDVVCKYFKVSKRVGKEYLKNLSKADIKEIEKSFDVGGLV